VLTDKSTYEALYNFLKFPPDSLLSQPLLLKQFWRQMCNTKLDRGSI